VPLDPLAAVEHYLNGGAASVDLLEIEGGRGWGINVAGVGFDARVAHRVNARRRISRGLATYLACVGAELVRHRPLAATIRIDDDTWRGPALLVAVANARSYGAGMLIAPHAEVDDGLLDVVLVEQMSRAEFLVNFPKVMRGTHLSHPKVRTWRGEEVVIETEEPSPWLIDGDVRGETPVEVRIAPGRARVWMPGGSA